VLPRHFGQLDWGYVKNNVLDTVGQRGWLRAATDFADTPDIL
jgi:hypothetical protein